LHSLVRRLTFGDEARFRRYLGGYFAVFTVPNYLGLAGRMLSYTVPGKVAAVYPVRQTARPGPGPCSGGPKSSTRSARSRWAAGRAAGAAWSATPATCPGPAVGGGTTVAVVGACMLASELKEADGDHSRAFGNYEGQVGSSCEPAAVSVRPR
jgi:hypothetical protein